VTWPVKAFFVVAARYIKKNSVAAIHTPLSRLLNGRFLFRCVMKAQ